MLLGREVVLHEVADLRLGNLMGVSAADSKVNSVNAVLFYSFNLSNLTSVHLYDSAWDSSSPFIPVVSHTNLITNQTSTLTFVSSRLALLKAVIGVDFSFETFEPRHACVIQNFGLGKVSHSSHFQFLNCPGLFKTKVRSVVGERSAQFKQTERRCLTFGDGHLHPPHGIHEHYLI